MLEHNLRNWEAQLGIELPTELKSKLDVLDSVKGFETEQTPIETVGLTDKTVASHVERLSQELASRAYEAQATAILAKALTDEIRHDAAELIPALVEQIRTAFDREVSVFKEAVRSLPKPPKTFNGNVIASTALTEEEIEAGEGALREAELAQSHINAVDSWLRANYACATPQLGIFHPAKWAQLQALRSVEGAYHPNGLRADLMFAATEGIGIGIADPGSAAELERRLWAAKQRRR